MPVQHTGGVQLLRRLAFPALIVLGLGFFAVAGLFGETDDGSVDTEEGLEGVTPVNRAEAQARQMPVVADLAAGYVGVLSLNDVTIPEDQLEPDDGNNRLTFRPGPGKVVTGLNARENCAAVTFWRFELGASTAGPAYRWCFNVS
ncbi:MAG: hypothetical protein ACKV2O_16905 [Acidimicrobiales bacterium]